MKLSPQHNYQNDTILIVDDNRDNLRVVSRMLNEQGYTIRLALDGIQALESAKTSPPDLILLDIMMPEMDGFAVCEALKAHEPTHDVPIIFVSALYEVVDKIKGFSVGGVDYITKPFQIEEVLARVRTHLSIRRMQQQLSAQNARLTQEIAERRRAEEAYITLAENTLHALMISQDKHIVYANPMATTLTGYSCEELCAMDSKGIIDLIHPDDQPFVLSYAMDCIANNPTPNQYTHRIVRKDGSIRWVEVFATLTQYRGRPASQASFLDITERKRAEQAYRTLVDHSLQGLIIVQDNRIVFANPIVESIYGYTTEELLAMSSQEVLGLIYPDDLPGVVQRMHAHLNGVYVPARNEHRIVQKSGDIRWVEVHGVLIEFDAIPAFQLAIMDITERRQTQRQLLQQQQALAMLRERERLARELHDNLGQVLGYVNIQAQTTRDLLTQGKVEQANTALSSMVAITQDTYTDMREFILGVTTSDTLTNGFFPTLERYLHRYEQLYHIQTRLVLSEHLADERFSPAVEAHLVRIVQEALSNARKHANATTVRVICTRIDENMQITIEDDGQGFDLNRHTTMPPDKTSDHGYGLRSLRERAQEIGGTLHIDTSLGNGTRVIVQFPYASPGMTLLRSLKILLVDDQPLFIEGLHNMLAARGIAVIGTAHNGNEALYKARRLHPDVILMDVEMPVCNGLDATRMIKAEMPDIQIVMLTVSAEDDYLFEAIKNGASGYLLKNLDTSDFFTLLAGLEQGEIALSPGMARKVLHEFSQQNASAHKHEAPHPQQASHNTEQIETSPETNTLSDDESPDELTDFQRDILSMVAQGYTYREVGEQVGYSERSIKNHMSDIIKKLHLRNRAAAIAYAKKVGLVT